MLRIPTAICLGLVLAGPALGATYLVDPQGNADFSTIRAAVDSASAGDVVELADGTFSGPDNREIDLLGKSITIRSRSGSAADCVIDCEDEGRAFFFGSGEGFGSVLQDLTITRGHARGANTLEQSGGALQCREGSSPTLTRCVFSENTADHVGGAIALAHDASPVITDCVFSMNEAQNGGALFAIDNCIIAPTGCRFIGNEAAVQGGAVYLYEASASFTACTFSANGAAQAGAISIYENSVLELTGCTLFGNHSGSRGTVTTVRSSVTLTNSLIAFSVSGTALQPFVSNTQVQCSNFYGNASGDWVGDLADMLGTGGNISVDPLFCSTIPGEEEYWGLRSDSPCAPAQSGCGLIGAWDVNCGTTPVRRTSWGRIKTLYDD